METTANHTPTPGRPIAITKLTAKEKLPISIRCQVTRNFRMFGGVEHVLLINVTSADSSFTRDHCWVQYTDVLYQILRQMRNNKPMWVTCTAKRKQYIKPRQEIVQQTLHNIKNFSKGKKFKAKD